MFNPVSTYRIQFNTGFTFAHLKTLVPYFKSLGIRTIYASPVFCAVPKSMHGYDVVDHNLINPEIGTYEELLELSRLLKENGISWLQDIVPNHVGFHHTNKWLMDFLEKGRQSAYASFFDHWVPHDDGKLYIPFLDNDLQVLISEGKLKVNKEKENFFLVFNNNLFPVNEPGREKIKALHPQVDSAVRLANGKPGFIEEILNVQFYKLVHWKESDNRINYRRFFTVNGLICLNMQYNEVMNATHSLVFDLLERSVFNGLRIDHIDGLYQPSVYLKNLRNKSGGDCYLLVEKILEPDEALPGEWPVQGTTGYEFLSLVNNLLINSDKQIVFKSYYQKFTDHNKPLQEYIFNCKAHILYNHMNGELDHLTDLFIQLLPEDKSFSYETLRKSVGAFLICCPVYRFYETCLPLNDSEKNNVQKVLSAMRLHFTDLNEVIDKIENVFFNSGNEDYEKQLTLFYTRCMQFTGPLMAKGVEDTLMYRYSAFIGNNEVGDSPGADRLFSEKFHNAMQERYELWPLAMNSTATHDTKRGEDARARLQALSDFPDEWMIVVNAWHNYNQKYKTNGFPDNNDEYFIYQTIVSTYPMPGITDDDYNSRIKDYLQKALREAKRYTAWNDRNEKYEHACENFLESVLADSYFRKSFYPLHHKVADHGILNAITQLILKHTCPGVPDTYQGTELWDLSFVDPDNRRQINYSLRQALLSEIEKETHSGNYLHKLWNERYSGKIKLFVLKQLLELRKNYQDLFEKGKYLPIKTSGKYAKNIHAFVRKFNRSWCMIVVPMHTGDVDYAEDLPLFDWDDTTLFLPEEFPKEWQDQLSVTKMRFQDQIRVNDLFQHLPFALLTHEYPENKRGAGILMPIASLPSFFSIGDFGPGAYAFADFLSRSNQKYWQLLPLNPVDKKYHSPYSSCSAFAGNELFISPDLLVKDELLTNTDLTEYCAVSTLQVDYGKAHHCKMTLLEKAYYTYKSNDFPILQKEFAEFCRKEAFWLNDFVYYQLLKMQHNSPWYEWPESYKNRHEDALVSLELECAMELQFSRWKQFIFYRQWKQLRAYCNDLGIKLIGDLPFYMDHDSADVWTNRNVFSLDDHGALSGVAGVPPDYFSETGQLWNMPTYNWKVLQTLNYDWWIKRLQKNLQMFDLLRIDHFRAFAEYWEVPFGEKTAVNGKWIPGPGKVFFEFIGKTFGKLPFIAEDLGYEMEKVYRLREELKLPGMKVLQFAFGENLSTAVDIPHNFDSNCIVYTGTHDNNTTLGWFRKETTRQDRERIEKYTGIRPSEKNINNLLITMAYASVADTVILPVQDILRLDERSRINTPGTNSGNWLWRLNGKQLSEEIELELRERTMFYNRF